MSINILLFGGTFDPVHYGHISLLNNAVSLVNPDKIIIIPASLPPHKKNAEVSSELRAKMCEIFCEKYSNASVEWCEISRQGRSYTADTVRYLADKYIGAKFYFCMGSDMLLYFTKWREYEYLMQSLCLVVQLRQNEDMSGTIKSAQGLAALGAEVLLAEGEVVNISSTTIREKIKNGEDISSFLPNKIEQIIKSHNLYTNEV